MSFLKPKQTTAPVAPKTGKADPRTHWSLEGFGRYAAIDACLKRPKDLAES